MKSSERLQLSYVRHSLKLTQYKMKRRLSKEKLNKWLSELTHSRVKTNQQVKS